MNYKDLMMKVLDIKGIDSSVGNDISPSFIKVLNRLRDKGIIIPIAIMVLICGA